MINLKIAQLKITLISLLLFPILPGCDIGPDLSNQPVNDDNQSNTTGLILPARAPDALSGSELIDVLTPLALREREARILYEILSGNIPDFMRTLVPVSITATIDDSTFEVIFHATADYLMLGSNDDNFLIPMTPILAQELADSLNASLVTRKMVDRIWQAATVKLAPLPIPPSSEMITIPVFSDHNDLVNASREAVLAEQPLGRLVAGHKKDVILSNRIDSNRDKVVIYGWHQLNGEPIQPLYSGHVNWYADYSHGIRLVHENCLVNGQVRAVKAILQDPLLYRLLSDENGPMSVTRYSTDKSYYP